MADVEALLSNMSVPKTKGMQGITTFISKILMDGKRYVPAPEGRIKQMKAKNARRTGLARGRRLDIALRDYVRLGRRPLVLGKVLARLRTLDIRPVAVQVRVAIQSVMIKTEIDAVATNPRGDVIVLELKNTQMTVKQHRASYHLPAARNSMLTNGLDNSERVRHSLQTAFGCMALQKMLGVSVRGMIVVNCIDGCVTHRLSAKEFCALALFK